MRKTNKAKIHSNPLCKVLKCQPGDFLEFREKEHRRLANNDKFNETG